jgi:hypothetical protein
MREEFASFGNFLVVSIIGIILLCSGVLTNAPSRHKNQRTVRRENRIANLLATASALYS